MAVFHSFPYNKIIALLNSSGLIAQDLYYFTDTQQLFFACTNTEGSWFLETPADLVRDAT